MLIWSRPLAVHWPGPTASTGLGPVRLVFYLCDQASGCVTGCPQQTTGSLPSEQQDARVGRQNHSHSCFKLAPLLSATGELFTHLQMRKQHKTEIKIYTHMHTHNERKEVSVYALFMDMHTLSFPSPTSPPFGEL